METGFTVAGLIFLSVAWGLILLLTIYCFRKVLKTGKKT